VDRTDALNIQELRESLDRVRESQDQERKLRGIVHRILDEGRDPGAIARIALEELLSLLDFERAFLLAGDPALPAEGDGMAFRVAAARALRRNSSSAGDDCFEDVPNPEFSLHRTTARRAFQSEDPLVLPDCLVRPGGEGEGVHRSVLCQSFGVGTSMPRAFYLDRPLGREPVEGSTLDCLSVFVERCLPIIERGFLRAEIGALRPGAAGTAAAVPDAAGGTDPSEEPILELPAEIPSFQGIIGASEKMQRIFQVIEKVKDSDLNICIFGESGTGKELVARAIHDASRRKDRMFVSENCGTIAENLLESELFGHLKGSFTGADEDRQGLFETANGGTLFLDEIGDMSEGMQRKLLRVLQEGMIRPIGSKQAFKVDVRVVCSSNKDLRALVQSGSFRVDLFYRVNVISIDVPPLRDRLDDIPILTAHFVREVEHEEGITRRLSESAMGALLKHNWPGNVRELCNVIRRVMVTCPRRTIVRKDLLPLLIGGQSVGFAGEGMERTESQIVLRIPRKETFNEVIDECERVVLLNSLRECRWNKSKVVTLLKIPRQSLYNKIEKHQLQRKWE